MVLSAELVATGHSGQDTCHGTRLEPDHDDEILDPPTTRKTMSVMANTDMNRGELSLIATGTRLNIAHISPVVSEPVTQGMNVTKTIRTATYKLSGYRGEAREGHSCRVEER